MGRASFYGAPRYAVTVGLSSIFRPSFTLCPIAHNGTDVSITVVRIAETYPNNTAVTHAMQTSATYCVQGELIIVQHRSTVNTFSATVDISDVIDRVLSTRVIVSVVLIILFGIRRRWSGFQRCGRSLGRAPVQK